MLSLYGVSNSSGNNAVIELGGVNNASTNSFTIFDNNWFRCWSITSCSTDSIIQAGGGGVNYNETSDYRLKSNIQPLDSAVGTIKALKPSNII